MKHCITRRNKGAREANIFTRIEIAVEAREIAARDFKAQRVSAEKHVARGPEIQGDLIDLPRIHQASVLHGITIAHAKDAFREILRESVRPNVNKLRGKVRICGRGPNEEIGRHWASHL